MAHKKAGGSSRNGRDSAGRRLGVKKFGGEVVLASQGEPADDFRIACVGDRVRYPDGSESVIVSGAGHASTYANRPIALVGSHIANGDRIVARAQSIGEIVVVEGEPIPGLLEPGYAPPGAIGA